MEFINIVILSNIKPIIIFDFNSLFFVSLKSSLFYIIFIFVSLLLSWTGFSHIFFSFFLKYSLLLYSSLTFIKFFSCFVCFLLHISLHFYNSIFIINYSLGIEYWQIVSLKFLFFKFHLAGWKRTMMSITISCPFMYVKILNIWCSKGIRYMI